MPQDDSMRPYVQIAAFCKTVLREANGNLSIIRIVDRHPVMGTLLSGYKSNRINWLEIEGCGSLESMS